MEAFNQSTWWIIGGAIALFVFIALLSGIALVGFWILSRRAQKAKKAATGTAPAATTGSVTPPATPATPAAGTPAQKESFWHKDNYANQRIAVGIFGLILIGVNYWFFQLYREAINATGSFFWYHLPFLIAGLMAFAAYGLRKNITPWDWKRTVMKFLWISVAFNVLTYGLYLLAKATRDGQMSQDALMLIICSVGLLLFIAAIAAALKYEKTKVVAAVFLIVFVAISFGHGVTSNSKYRPGGRHSSNPAPDPEGGLKEVVVTSKVWTEISKPKNRYLFYRHLYNPQDGYYGIKVSKHEPTVRDKPDLVFGPNDPEEIQITNPKYGLNLSDTKLEWPVWIIVVDKNGKVRPDLSTKTSSIEYQFTKDP